MNFLRFILLASFTFAPCLSGSALSAKIYKWVDEKGVVHFSDRQPQSDKLKGKVEEREMKDPSEADQPKDTVIHETARNPIEYVTQCTFTIKGEQKTGSGFFISSNGHAVTCKHVVEHVADLVAVLNDESECPLNIISLSANYDLALVQVLAPKKTPHIAVRRSEDLAPGDRLFAVGASAGLQSTVTDGVFTGFRTIPSATGRLIQFSAPLNPGNSGGPLVDEKGKLVGVVSLKFLSVQGKPVSGVGFAVPSAQVTEEYGSSIQK